MGLFNAPVSGLWTAPNTFSQAPAGSLAVADNVVFSGAGVLEPRKGFSQIPGEPAIAFDNYQLASYNRFLLSWASTNQVQWWDQDGDAIGLTPFSGTFRKPGVQRMKFMGGARDLFFSTSTGVKMVSGPDRTLLDFDGHAGGDWVVGSTVTGSTSAASGVIIDGSELVAATGTLILASVEGIFEDNEILTSGGVSAAADGPPYRTLAEPVSAGNPPGVQVLLNSLDDGTGSWMNAGTNVAYRYTFCSEDAYGRLIEGAPSGRFVVSNYISVAVGQMTRAGTTVTVNTEQSNFLNMGDVVTLAPGEGDFAAGDKTVATIVDSNTFTYTEAGAAVSNTVAQVFSVTRHPAVRLLLGDEVTTSNFLRLYRSAMSEDQTIQPDDEMYLVYESPFFDGTDISNGYYIVDDITPESLLGDVPLYTNANTGQGIGQANTEPPIAEDLAFFADRMWFLNTTQKQSLELSLIAVGGSGGITATDTVTVAGTTYTAVAGAPGSQDQFTVVTSGSAAENIRETSQNFIRAINEHSQTVVAGYYISSEDGFPGKLLIQETGFGGSVFTAASDAPATTWNPPLSTDGDVTSDNNRHPGGLYYSKLGQPDAVPLLNFLQIGSDNFAGIRCVPLTYRLIIFKEDGIFFVNDTEPFSVQKMSEAKLIAPDSIGLLGERLYCLCDQGLMSISDSGVTNVGEPIDNVLRPLLGSGFLETVYESAYGVGFEAARQYLLWLPEEIDEVTPENSNAYVFSTESGGFTRYDFGVRAAIVEPANGALTVLLSSGITGYVFGENRVGDETDYRDRRIDFTVTSSTSTTLTGSFVSPYLPAAGDVILDDDDVSWLITAVEQLTVTTATLTLLGVDADDAFTNGAHSSYAGIACNVAFNPVTGGQPATMKMFNQVSLLNRGAGTYLKDVTFSTEVDPAESSIEFQSDVWGEFPWGEAQWGNDGAPINRIEPLPIQAANCCQLSVGIETRQADAKFQLLGFVAEAQEDTIANRG